MNEFGDIGSNHNGEEFTVKPEIQSGSDPIRDLLDKQKELHGTQIIATSDLDDTWVKNIKPDDPDREEKIARFNAATQQINSICEENFVPRVAVTGRPLEGVLSDPRLYEGGTLDSKPHFACIESAVGTEIHLRQQSPDGQWTFVEDPRWTKKIEEERKFIRDQVYPICQEIKNDINTKYADFNLIFQERDAEENVAAWQKFKADGGEKPTLGEPERRKISYRFRCKDNDPNDDIDDEDENDAGTMYLEFQNRLALAGYPNLQIVISHAQNLPNGFVEYNMDIVPVTKLEAIEYLEEKYGAQIIYAEDSENGANALERYGGVMVGGRKKGLQSRMENRPFIKRSNWFLRYTDEKSGATRLLFKKDKKTHTTRTSKKADDGEIATEFDRKTKDIQGPESLVEYANVLKRLKRFQDYERAHPRSKNRAKDTDS